MDRVLALLLSLWFALTAAVLRPTSARCPPGHDLRTGIRASGHFACWPSPQGDADYDGTWGKPERSVQSLAVLASRLYCTGVARPIVVDFRTVACKR